MRRLHRCGERPVGEVSAEALHRLQPSNRAAVLDLAERITPWPPETIEALGARDFAPAPLIVIRRAA